MFFYSKTTLDRLGKMNVTCSNRCALNKMDDLGTDYDKEQKEVQKAITDENLKIEWLQKLEEILYKAPYPLYFEVPLMLISLKMRSLLEGMGD